MSNYKPTIVHVIDSLKRGGAETMLVNLLNGLEEYYDIILVTLSNVNEFRSEEINCTMFYSLNHKTTYNLPSVFFKLKKIIKKHNPDIIRTQLFWSTILGRLVCPPKTKFIFSIHSQLSLDSFSKNRGALWLERLTYKERHNLISVSEEALSDYKKMVNVKGKCFILHNFVDDKYFKKEYKFKWNPNDILKVVAVGNLKDAKNYFFLLDVIKKIHLDVPISLDIIGEGALHSELQKYINNNNLPVNLLGIKNDIEEHLPNYHVFIMCSKYEGFGIAPIEAMAIGLPLILNDLKVMKEITEGNAIFFESDNLQSIITIFRNLEFLIPKLKLFSNLGRDFAKSRYSKERYLNELHSIYNSILAN